MTFGEKIDKVLENQAKHEVRLDNFAKDQAEHHESLYDKKDGVVIEVDRLKGFKKIACALFTVLGVSVLGGVVRFIFTHLGH